ncbi:MAG: hypothetical protein JOZ22_09730, partial [Acidobacteriia bacterium]|nr:hypothetical protein [Terriglobia bacterium]
MRTVSWTVCLISCGASIAFAQNTPVDPAIMAPYAARATQVSGKVDRVRDEMPWAVSNGERVPIQQTITTG